MPHELDFSARKNCVCFNLRRVARVVTQFFDAEMRRHGIRSTQGTLLSALHGTGTSTMKYERVKEKMIDTSASSVISASI